MKTPLGSINPAHKDVHIWGGGVAGLLMAHFLSRQGFHIHLYERSDRLGGKIHSHVTPEGVIEEGPNAIYATSQIEAWLEELGIKIIPATKKLKRRIWQGKPLAPLSMGLIKQIVPRLFDHTPSLSDGITIAQFFRPLMGKYVETILSPALQGIYGCGAEELTVTGVWPHLQVGTYWKALRSLKGPAARSVSFAGGMKDFIDALKCSFEGRVHLNYTGAFELRPNTIICTSAHDAAHLLNGTWAEGARQLEKLRYRPLSSVTVIASTPPEAKLTFGFLFPRGEGIHSLGVLFNKEIFPGRAGHTFIVPSERGAEQYAHDDSSKLNWRVESMKIHSWDRALPHYDQTRTLTLRALLQDPYRPSELVLFGNYVAGISLRDMIQVAQTFAKKSKA